jgi:hypothetical protein
MTWLARYWVSMALLSAIGLLGIALIYAADWPLSLILIFLHSRGYMLH